LTVGHADESFLCETWTVAGRKVNLRGLFFCPVVINGSLIKSVFGLVPDRPAELKPFRDIALQAAMDVRRSAKPTVFIAYVYSPIGHTAGDFDFSSPEQFDAYREQFVSQSLLATEVIERNIVSIRSVDPAAIVLVFGDHGSYLSRSFELVEDPKFFYADRHRVFLAVASGGHHCGSPAQVHSGGIYNTPSRMLLDIMLCLSGGVTRLPVDFEEDQQLLRWVFQ